MHPESKEESLLRRYWPLLLGTVGAYLTFRPIWEHDLFWHLALGKSVLAAHARVVREPLAVAGFRTDNMALEWLWEVLAYLSVDQGGWALLAAFTMLLSAGVALALWRMIAALTPGVSPAAQALASALALSVVSARLRERPETAALALLPLFVLLAFRFADEPDGRKRLRRGAGLVALQILLAQIHPYFVLTAPVFAVAAVPPFWRHPERRAHFALFGALLGLGLLTSAEGMHIFATLRTNALGDIARHVLEARDITWEVFNPARFWIEPAFMLLTALALLGIVTARRVDLRLLGLAALGLLALSAAMRGLILAGVFMAPLGAWALGQITARVRPRAAAPVMLLLLVAAGLALVKTVQHTDRLRGPLGTIGLSAGEFPEAAAAYFKAQPSVTKVLTSYSAGPALWFLSEGNVRTYVDGRTPLVFDAVEFALSRAAGDYRAAFDAVMARYGFEAAVIDRTAKVCESLAGDPAWALAASDPRHAAFVPRARVERPLKFVAPCGAVAVASAACESVPEADAEIARVEEIAPAYGRFLRVSLHWRCVQAQRVPALIDFMPSEPEAQAFSKERALLLAEMYFSFGHAAEALRLTGPLVEQGNPAAVELLIAAAGRPGDEERLYPQLDQAHRRLGDAAPPMLDVALAWNCKVRGDAVCARYHAMRAAVTGTHGAEPVLAWLAQTAPDEHARADVRRWYQVFAAAFQPTPGRPE